MITVLRLGHRLGRDLRVTTHCGLVSRALGADEMILSGDKDSHCLQSLTDVIERWGGDFSVRYEKSWKSVLKDAKDRDALIIHLTMYGINLPDAISDIRSKCIDRDILLVVGSQKVPGEVYDMADYNLAVGNTPHSEIAALTLFLHEYFEGKELRKEFPDAQIKVIPSSKGKITEKNE